VAGFLHLDCVKVPYEFMGSGRMEAKQLNIADFGARKRIIVDSLVKVKRYLHK
jgi:hypothetical protein